MKTAAWMPALLLALAPLSAYAIDDTSLAPDARVAPPLDADAKGSDAAEHGASDAKAESSSSAEETDAAKQACEQREQDKGHHEASSKIVCAVKVLFQSRILRKTSEEPVEMTVGSPPMITDDTDTPGDKTWEVNVVVDGTLDGGERQIEAPLLDINYGIGDRLQLKYEVPYILSRTTEPAPGGGSTTVHASSVGDSNFGLKYRFYDNEDSGLSFAFYPQVSFHTPGAPRRVSEGHTEIILPVLMTKEFEHSSISANLGVEATSDEHRWFASFGVGRRLTDHVALLAEIAGTDLNASDERRILFNIGLRGKLNEKQAVMGSIGHDLHAGGDQDGQAYFSIAFQQLFGD